MFTYLNVFEKKAQLTSTFEKEIKKKENSIAIFIYLFLLLIQMKIHKSTQIVCLDFE